MEKLSVATPLGDVWLWRNPGAEALPGPVLLAILGAFAPVDHQWSDFPDEFPGRPVYVATLPGHGGSPALEDSSLAAMAKAFDHVMGVVAPGRAILALGNSVGGLVACAMDTPADRLLLDPPICGHKVWPCTDMFRRIWREEPQHRAFLHEVFGLTETGVEPRDHLHLVRPPARALVGAVPLYPERPFDQTPSLVDEPERERLRHRLGPLGLVQGVGHMIAGRAPLVVLKVLREMLSGL